ncbi:hypothetical protein PCE1_002536 [Barthelona sp. PCE]
MDEILHSDAESSVGAQDANMSSIIDREEVEKLVLRFHEGYEGTSVLDRKLAIETVREHEPEFVIDTFHTLFSLILSSSELQRFAPGFSSAMCELLTCMYSLYVNASKHCPEGLFKEAKRRVIVVATGLIQKEIVEISDMYAIASEQLLFAMFPEHAKAQEEELTQTFFTCPLNSCYIESYAQFFTFDELISFPDKNVDEFVKKYVLCVVKFRLHPVIALAHLFAARIENCNIPDEAIMRVCVRSGNSVVLHAISIIINLCVPSKCIFLLELLQSHGMLSMDAIPPALLGKPCDELVLESVERNKSRGRKYGNVNDGFGSTAFYKLGKDNQPEMNVSPGLLCTGEYISPSLGMLLVDRLSSDMKDLYTPSPFVTPLFAKQTEEHFGKLDQLLSQLNFNPTTQDVINCNIDQLYDMLPALVDELSFIQYRIGSDRKRFTRVCKILGLYLSTSDGNPNFDRSADFIRCIVIRSVMPALTFYNTYWPGISFEKLDSVVLNRWLVDYLNYVSHLSSYHVPIILCRKLMRNALKKIFKTLTSGFDTKSVMATVMKEIVFRNPVDAMDVFMEFIGRDRAGVSVVAPFAKTLFTNCKPSLSTCLFANVVLDHVCQLDYGEFSHGELIRPFVTKFLLEFLKMAEQLSPKYTLDIVFYSIRRIDKILVSQEEDAKRNALLLSESCFWLSFLSNFIEIITGIPNMRYITIYDFIKNIIVIPKRNSNNVNYFMRTFYFKLLVLVEEGLLKKARCVWVGTDEPARSYLVDECLSIIEQISTIVRHFNIQLPKLHNHLPQKCALQPFCGWDIQLNTDHRKLFMRYKAIITKSSPRFMGVFTDDLFSYFNTYNGFSDLDVIKSIKLINDEDALTGYHAKVIENPSYIANVFTSLLLMEKCYRGFYDSSVAFKFFHYIIENDVIPFLPVREIFFFIAKIVPLHCLKRSLRECESLGYFLREILCLFVYYLNNFDEIPNCFFTDLDANERDKKMEFVSFFSEFSHYLYNSFEIGLMESSQSLDMIPIHRRFLSMINLISGVFTHQFYGEFSEELVKLVKESFTDVDETLVGKARTVIKNIQIASQRVYQPPSTINIPEKLLKDIAEDAAAAAEKAKPVSEKSKPFATDEEDRIKSRKRSGGPKRHKHREKQEHRPKQGRYQHHQPQKGGRRRGRNELSHDRMMPPPPMPMQAPPHHVPQRQRPHSNRNHPERNHPDRPKQHGRRQFRQ